MSRMEAPAVMCDLMVWVREARSVEECRPPSEKESGVRFRMAITWVWRRGSSAFSGGRFWQKGVAVDKGAEAGGRAFR